MLISPMISCSNPTTWVSSTVADLRTTEPSKDGQLVYLSGHTTIGVGGGEFYYDASDTTSADNGGTVIVTSGGKRWIRILDDNTVSLEDFGCSSSLSNTEFEAALVASQADNLKLTYSTDILLTSFTSTKTYLNLERVGGEGRLLGGNIINVSGEITLKNLKLKDWSRFNSPAAQIDKYHAEGIDLENCLQGLIYKNGAIDNTTYSVNNVRIVGCKCHSVPDTSDKTAFVRLDQYVETVLISGNTIEDLQALPIATGSAVCYGIIVGVEADELSNAKDIVITNNIIQTLGRAGTAAEDDNSYGIRATGLGVLIQGNTVKDLVNGDPIYGKGQGVRIDSNSVENCDEGGISIKGINNAAGTALNTTTQSVRNVISNNTILNDNAIEGGALLSFGAVNVIGNTIDIKDFTDSAVVGINAEAINLPTADPADKIIISGNTVKCRKSILATGEGRFVITDNILQSDTDPCLDIRAFDGDTPESIILSNNDMEMISAGKAISNQTSEAMGSLDMHNNRIKTWDTCRVSAKHFSMSDNVVETLAGVNGIFVWSPQVSGSTIRTNGNQFIINGGVAQKGCFFLEASAAVNYASFSDSVDIVSGTLQRVYRVNNDNAYGRVTVVGCNAGVVDRLIDFTGNIVVSRLNVSSNSTDAGTALVSASGTAITGDGVIISDNMYGSGGAITTGTLTFTATSSVDNLSA